MSTTPTPNDNEPESSSEASSDQTSNSDNPKGPAKYTYDSPPGSVTSNKISVSSIEGSRMAAEQHKKGIKTIYTYDSIRPSDAEESGPFITTYVYDGNKKAK